jgi:protein gp37
MSHESQWWDTSVNFWIGCTWASPACDHCWAKAQVRRFGHLHKPGWKKGDPPADFGTLRFHPEALDKPLTWKTPRRVFVCGLSDFCHPQVDADWKRRALNVMWRCKQHTFYLLSKRPERYPDLLQRYPYPLRNVWLGATVESQEYAHRLDPLRALHTMGWHTFVSFEPLLGPIRPDLTGIEWIIIGGESGPRARKMDCEWARVLMDVARQARVPVWMKQMGSWWWKEHGDIETFPRDLRVRERP